MSMEQEPAGSESCAIEAFARVHRLSPQEARLVEAAMRELSNDEIAHEFGCSSSTIRTYWSRILQKVGCSRHHHVFARIARFAVSWSTRAALSYVWMTEGLWAP